MGIPSYFSHLIKEHRKIVQTLQTLQCVDNLYLDSNSIIYDIIHSYEKTPTNMNTVYNDICKKIDKYIETCDVQNRIIVAFDGVAPVAKLEQQRTRRFKTTLLSKLTKELKDNKSEAESKFDTTCITPGTEFMTSMCKYIKNYYKPNKKVILSLSDEAGEGEHKIFDYIRNNFIYHTNTTTLIYGLDADLIMLCLNHLDVCPNIYLYRETPEFVKSIDTSINPNESYLLDIPFLAQRIILEMNGNKKPSTTQETNKLYDYIFLCFFLGNDFLPHFPSVNIRTNGIDIMLNAYKEVIGNQNLTNGTIIYWKNVRKLVKFLAENEYDNLMDEYEIRQKWERRSFKSGTKEEKINKYLNIPIKNREIEKYINPYESFWQKRYYEALFNTDETHEFKKEISVNYMEGLEWVMNYYTRGCVDWRWHYKYNYPPLFNDLLKFIPSFDTVMIAPNNHTNVSPCVQLSYVLPIESLPLIPNNIGEKLLKERGEYYTKQYDIKWAFCKYMWESHLELPHIDLEDLEEFVINI